MCLSPISIINPTRYISKVFRQPYVLEVPCGDCVECRSVKSLEWQYRMFYEFKDCFHSGGYVYFDTLTYDNAHVPRVNDVLGTTLEDNFMCFDYHDFQSFMMRFRKNLSKQTDIAGRLRYFVCTEYGTGFNSTHRPHLHLLLFVNADISPFALSLAVSNSWKNGRTDGMPFRDARYVVTHNVIRNIDSSLPAMQYVAKYVSKSCVYQSLLDQRVQAAFDNLTSYVPDKDKGTYRKSKEGRELYNYVKRSINQFHKQSSGFGLSMLNELDLIDLVNTNSVVSVQFGKSLPKMSIGLPMYYKRKLFYDLCKHRGKYIWVINEDGLRYKNLVNDVLKRDLSVKYHSVLYDKCAIDKCLELADYALNMRGYINVGSDLASLIDVVRNDKLYNYVTSCDYDKYHHRFLSHSDDDVSELADVIDVNQFVKDNVYYDDSLEALISLYNDRMIHIREHKSLAAYKKEVIKNKYKQYGLLRTY